MNDKQHDRQDAKQQPKQENLRPQGMGGMRHVAIFVEDLEACEEFYVDLLGMKVEWRPDADNLFLCSGNDNLALHRFLGAQTATGTQKLDHIGFIIDTPAQVDAWHEYLLSHNVEMRTAPKLHRDGARSFYCVDPVGTMVQLIYHPPISGSGN